MPANGAADAPPEYHEGDQFSAGWLTRLIRFLVSLRIIGGPGVLVSYRRDGQYVRVNLPQECDARVDSGANPYACTEVFAVAGGTWATRADSRTFAVGGAHPDPLYERNAYASVPALTVVHARRDVPSGAWIFDRTSCTATATAPTTPTSPNPVPPGPTPTGGTKTLGLFDLSASPTRHGQLDSPAGLVGIAPVQEVSGVGGTTGVSTMTFGGP